MSGEGGFGYLHRTIENHRRNLNVISESWCWVKPELEYPKYFGYHTKFRGISEPVRI